MVSEIYLIRDRIGGTAIESYIHNGVKIGDYKVRTGISGQKKNDEWTRKIAGIPTGDLWLWNIKEYIQQYNDLDVTGREIGRFYPISSSKSNHRIIKSIDGKERWEIGKHCENDYPFSLGCPVTVDHSIWRVMCKHLDDTPQGHIPYRVRWTAH